MEALRHHTNRWFPSAKVAVLDLTAGIAAVPISYAGVITGFGSSYQPISA
jgi:hypothetical protein